MNYRKYYEYHTGNKIPEGYQVHHLDFNRNNNAIENLVAIPDELHRRFHRVHLKFSRALSELTSCRYFSRRPTETLIEHIRQYTIIRSELYSYEAEKENYIYHHGNR